MCGIVGYVGPRQCVDLIVGGLRKLEYRGYDSAGVAAIGPGGLAVTRAKGKLQNLVAVLKEKPLAGTTGIGHTRWATHGRPSDENAHPHLGGDGSVAVGHNGVIDDFQPLQDRPIRDGYAVRSAAGRRATRIMSTAARPSANSPRSLRSTNGPW